MHMSLSFIHLRRENNPKIIIMIISTDEHFFYLAEHTSVRSESILFSDALPTI